MDALIIIISILAAYLAFIGTFLGVAKWLFPKIDDEDDAFSSDQPLMRKKMRAIR